MIFGQERYAVLRAAVNGLVTFLTAVSSNFGDSHAVTFNAVKASFTSSNLLAE
jgi:hypothetical protein